MRKFLLAAIAALTLGVGSASAYASQVKQTGIGTGYRVAWVDHTRAAEPGDYNS